MSEPERGREKERAVEKVIDQQGREERREKVKRRSGSQVRQCQRREIQ